MLSKNRLTLCLALYVLMCPNAPARAQSQTTGRITGTVKDPSGAVLSGAEVTVVSQATGEDRKGISDDAGYYAVPLLPPGIYRVSVTATGFKKTEFDRIHVVITETTTVNADLAIGAVNETLTITDAAPLVQIDGPRLGRVVDTRMVSELPLATRNFTQILALSPGTSVDLPDNTAVGRNSQNISVNGARMTQNNYQINGVDANSIGGNNAQRLAVPAPETIQEFKVQTSLYDATFGRSGGGNVQVVTRSGGNFFRGTVYEYFRNDALNANSPTLKAAGVERPVLQRNVFGAMFGGPIRKERSFFFVSYQGTRERNGVSPNSQSSDVLIDPALTDDRSEQTLRATYNLPSIHPIALALLNLKLPSGQFLIPTPQVNGRYSGSTPSRYREDQFNTNFDYRFNDRNWLTLKVFSSNAPSTLELFGGPNVPGFAAEQENDNRVISLQDVHAFSSKLMNEARLGYNLVTNISFPQEPVSDGDIGIRRANASTFPGLPLFRIAPNSGGVTFGTATANIDVESTIHSTTASDTLSIMAGKHSIRTGIEVIYHQTNITSNQFSRGQIDFNSFNDFLRGTVSQSVFGTGINYRSLRSTDYSFFVHDDWKVSRKWTLNLGLRYELDMPPYDTRGRISTFDPALYRPRLDTDSPVGPPAAGFVQAGNVIAEFNLPDLPKVGKRVLRSVDPNNFAPRFGFAYSPLVSGRLVVRSGYGIFYSRLSNFHLATTIQLPPNYVVGRRQNPPSLADPFFATPTIDQFPTFVTGINLSSQVFDRNMRTPYFHQYNTSVQYAFGKDLLFEAAYVGSRGLNQFRQIGINQARLASPERPIINEVTGQVITTNLPGNALLRAPFQGIDIMGFGQRQTTAQSTYNSLQISVTKRFSRGLQFLGSYSYAKSIDNASGANTNDVGGNLPGNQLDNRANRSVSDFDRTHRFVVSYLWELPQPAFASRTKVGRWLMSDWQVAGIVIAMSGLPIDVVDSVAGQFYGLNAPNGLARPNYAPGATRDTAMSNVPEGYFFNPRAFARPVVLAGQPIPSSNGAAIAGATGTDIGMLGRNVLREPHQSNVDFSVMRRFRVGESKNFEFRVEFFNLFNHVNLANPISNLNAVSSENLDPNTGRIIGDPGAFGRILGTNGNPRLIQSALKFNF